MLFRSHFSISIWQEENELKVLLALPWKRVDDFDRLISADELREREGSQTWSSRQWNALDQVFFRKHEGFLLISNSRNRSLVAVPQVRVAEEGLFLYADKVALRHLGFSGSRSIRKILGKSSAQGKTSPLELTLELEDSERNKRWLSLLEESQLSFQRDERDVLQIQCSISSLIEQPEVRERLAKASPKQAPALKWLVDALSGYFGIHGYYQDGRAQGSLTAGFNSPGSSAQAIEKIESLLQLRGGVLAELNGGGSYSITLPFLPVTLFLSRVREYLSLSTAPLQKPGLTKVFSEPAFFHGLILLDQIADDLLKGLVNVKEQYHIRKLRQCLQIRRLETGVFRRCPLGPGFTSVQDGLNCPLHGALSAPGSVLARDQDQRFDAFDNFLAVFKFIHVRGMVQDNGLKFVLINHSPDHQK